MPTENFNYIQPAVAHGKNVALQSQAWGDPVDGKVRAEAPGDSVQLAGLFSTAPYVEPTDKTRKGRCHANGDTCLGFATKRWPGLCAAHGMKAEG